MRTKDVGIYLSVFSLLFLVLLFEHKADLEPQWVWRWVRVGCLLLTFYSLRLFAAGIKQEVRDELRGAASKQGTPIAEPGAAADGGA